MAAAEAVVFEEGHWDILQPLMPRIGLPTNSKSAAPAPPGRSSSSPLSPSAVLRIAAAAIVFRAISALVAMFIGHVFPHGIAAASESSGASFGIYPLLTRELARAAGGVIRAPVTPALVITWLAFAGAMVMMQRVAQLDIDAERGDSAALLAAVFPFASVFGHANADALFLLFVLATFYGFRQGRWIAGGLCGALATATLPAGILILPGLAWTGWRRERRASTGLLLALIATACGLIGYFTYWYYRGGPPGGWSTAMDQWGFHFVQAPWTVYQRLHSAHPSPVGSLGDILALVFIAAVTVVWWRFDGGYALYMMAMLWAAATTGRPDELGRACAMLFPVFVLIAGVRWRLIPVATAVASAMFYALVLAL